MPAFLVETTRLQSGRERINRLGGRVAGLREDCSRIRSALDWDVKDEQQLDQKLSRLISELCNILNNISGAVNCLTQIEKVYLSCSNQTMQLVRELPASILEINSSERYTSEITENKEPKIVSVPGQTITSETSDPMMQVAISESNIMLGDLLSEFHSFEWPSGYSIIDYSWSSEYKRRYQGSVDRAKDVASFFDTIDLAAEIWTSYEEVAGVTGGEPYTTVAGTVVATAIKEFWDREPGIGDIPDALGINGILNENIAKAMEKSTFIENSDYKYLIYSGQFLWEEGPRGKFISEITELEKRILDRSEIQFDNEAENMLYKQALLKRLSIIKNMNINYDESLSGMKSFLSIIDEKYQG